MGRDWLQQLCLANTDDCTKHARNIHFILFISSKKKEDRKDAITIRALSSSHWEVLAKCTYITDSLNTAINKAKANIDLIISITLKTGSLIHALYDKQCIHPNKSFHRGYDNAKQSYIQWHSVLTCPGQSAGWPAREVHGTRSKINKKLKPRPRHS